MVGPAAGARRFGCKTSGRHAQIVTIKMRPAFGGPRLLLRRLREVMAEQISAQERLDKIVVLIAANMVAEVCSTYVLRVDNTCLLYTSDAADE